MAKLIVLGLSLVLSSSALAHYCGCVVIEEGIFKGHERLVRYYDDGSIDTSYMLGIYRPGECSKAKEENPHCKNSSK